MSVLSRVLRTAAMAALVSFSVAVVASDAAYADENETVGKAATPFDLRDINGQKVQLESLRGKVILLSFWATWCAPCKEEMPHLNKLYLKHKDNGFVVLSISSDDARTGSRVKPYIKSKGFSFPVLLDPSSKATTAYNPNKTLPWTVVIDRDFKIAKVHSGFNPGDEKEIEELVEKLVHAGASHSE